MRRNSRVYFDKARAKRRSDQRCGELLREFDARGGDQSKKEDDHLFASASRANAAQEAGLSEHQAKTAVRVANVPNGTFEELIEGDKPPTVTALAEMGKKERPKPLIDLERRDPDVFRRGIRTPFSG